MTTKRTIECLFKVLLKAKPFDTVLWTAHIEDACENIGLLSKLKEFMPPKATFSAEHQPNVFANGSSKVTSYAEKNDDLKKALTNLTLASLGLGLFEIKDDLGFNQAVIKNGVDQLNNESVLVVLPKVLQVYIEAVINEYNEELRRRQQPSESEGRDPMDDPEDQPLKPLSELCQDPKLVVAFGERLLSSVTIDELNTIEKMNQTDLKKNYLLCILFVQGYFQFKGTPPVTANAESNARLLPVLQSWLETSTSASEKRTFAAVIREIIAAKAQGRAAQTVVKDWAAFTRDLGLIIQPFSALYVPNANTNATLWDVARTALETAYPGAKNVWDSSFVTTLPREMETLAMTFKQNWYTQVGRLRHALQKSQNNTVTVREDWFRTGTVFPDLYKITERGSEIVDTLKRLNYLQCKAFNEPNAGKRTVNVFVKAMMKSEFYSQPSDFRNRKFDGLPPSRGKWDTGSYEIRQEQLKSGCFAPGTLIWTSYGERPIETLRENDKILTSADASGGQWGVKSDEVVANPVPGGSAMLYGFNDGPAFFTQNHVFRTTTGLRALDPLAAKRENPWLEVGELRAGHTLLHTKDGSTYHPVTIIRFNRRVVECDNVWGIHLREGLRSYHANGYLVHLNYPEITIKSIADTLKQFPSEQRTKMLGHIKELQPIFERFGGATVGQLLARELEDDELLVRLRHKTPEEFAPPPLYFQSRSYDITTKDQGPNDYSVPMIDALDGVLYVDGEPCTRSTIFARGFSWSRQLSDDGLYEHGMCTFGADKKLISGDGLIWLERDPNPAKPTTSPIRFQSNSISLRHAYIDMPKTEFYARQVAELVELRSELQVTSEATQATKQTTPQDEFDELVASTSVDPHTLIGDTKAYEANERLAQKVEGRLPRQVENQPTNVDQTFEVKLDPEPFDPMSSSDNFETNLCSVVRKIVGRKEEANTYTYRIPELEELARRRNQKLGTSSIDYQIATDVYDSKNNWEVLITITNPIALALAADDNVQVVNGVEEPISFENLTFKNSGSSLVIPFMFSKLQFRVTATGFRGKLCRYEPDPTKAAEEEGVRHLVQGTIVHAKPSTEITAQGSRSSAAPTSPGQPAPLTQDPEAARLIKSVTNLVTNLAAPSDKIKEDAQRYLYQAMIYHMDAKERDELAGANLPPVSSDPSRPETLPSELADGLDDDLKDWLKNTYAVAYLANNLSQQSKTQQEKFLAVFTERDIKRLEYYYRGRGRNCLAQTPQYKRLNTMAAVSAFRRRVPKVVDYITDISKADVPTEKEGDILKDAKGGIKWAYLYFHEITRSDFIKQIAQSCSYVEHTNLNLLEYHTTVLNVLWGGTPGSQMDGAKLGEILAGMVSREVTGQPLFRLALVESAKSLESGLHDHFASLLDILLDPQKSAAAGIGTEMRKKLTDSLAAQADWQTKHQTSMAKDQKEAMIRGAAGAIKSVASTVSGTEKGIRGLPKFLQAIKARVTGKAVPESVPVDVSGPVSTKTKITAGLGFALTLAATTYYVMTSMESWGQWNDLDGLDRAKLVTGALQAAGGFVFSTYKAVQVYKGWDKLGKGSAEATHAAASELEMVVRPRANAMNPKLAKQASEIGTRPRANAVVVKEFGDLGSKTKNTSEALLSAKKPSGWTKLKDKLSAGKSKLASKMKFNATETTMRTFAVAVSAVMLVLSCISLAQNWDKLDDTEKWLSVLGLIINLVSLVLEVIVLFACISPLWAIGVALAGIIVSIFLGRHQAKKKGPDSPVTDFFNKRAKPFLERLSDPPPLTFDWKLEPSSANTNSDTTVVIHGLPFKGDRSLLTKNLASVRITFHSGANQSAALFSTPGGFSEKEASKELGQNQVNIVYPKALDKDFDVGLVESSVAGTSVRTWVCKIEQKDLGKLLETYKRNTLPYIDGLDEIKFELRGFISKKADQPKDEKPEEGKIPSWAKYTIRIQEQYNGEDGNPKEMLEQELVFEKK